MTQINTSKTLAMISCIGSLMVAGCSSNPVAGGIQQGKLTDCPSSPNCVSSVAKDEDHGIAALQFTGTQGQAKEKLIEVISNYPGTHIVKNEDNYLHVEFTTKLMGFVDDGEFLVADDKIQLRSASRVGYGDLGKNRSRMEEIRSAFEPCCQ